MGICICKNRIRNEREVIVGYVIQDIQTKIENVYDSSQMKNILASGTLNVQNLTLTSDGRILMSDKQFRRPVVKKRTVVNDDLGQQADKFLYSLLSFNYDRAISNVLKCTDFNIDGVYGSFTLLVNTSLIGLDAPIELKFRYRRVISKYVYRDNTAVIGFVIQLLGVGHLDNLVSVDDTNKLKLTGLLYDSVSGQFQTDVSVYSKQFIAFIESQCIHLCKVYNNIELKQLKYMAARLHKSFEMRGIKLNISIIQILCCIEVLFSNDVTLNSNL